MAEIIYKRPPQHICRDELDLITDNEIGMVVKCSCAKNYICHRNSYYSSSRAPAWEPIGIFALIAYKYNCWKNKK